MRVPKNLYKTQLCVQSLQKNRYAQVCIQITVADTDGIILTLKEASSWGKVDISKEQMVFAEAIVLPLIASDAFHRQNWKKREKENSAIFK